MVTTLDYVILFAYLLIILIIGVYSSKREHLEGYLANNRKTKLYLLTFSNISTFIGAGAVVTVASTAYTSGISYAIVVLISLVIACILYALIAPKIKRFGDSARAYTVGHFLEYRYGISNRYVFAFFYILLAFLWMAIQFVAIAQLLKVLLGINFLFALIASVVVTIIYTSLAGLISDMLTDFFQFWVMLLTFLILIPVLWVRSDGLTALTSLPSSYFDPMAFGGVAFLIGGIFLSGLVLIPSVHYWQRIYAAESLQTSRKSFLYSIPGILFFVCASALVGLFAVSLLPQAEPDSVLFVLMTTYLPSGLLGLCFAGIIAVVMSSIDSLLIGGSATILKDIYQPLFRPKAQEHELLNMVRYITVIFGLIGALVAFFFQNIVTLSLLTAFTALCFVPTILGGLFWKRATAKASISSLLSSLIVLFVLFPFMPKTAFLPSFFIGILVLVLISFFSRHSPSEHSNF